MCALLITNLMVARPFAASVVGPSGNTTNEILHVPILMTTARIIGHIRFSVRGRATIDAWKSEFIQLRLGLLHISGTGNETRTQSCHLYSQLLHRSVA